ncbi:hypothetical protein LC605_25710 [Nostoc sp. CHAB 5836]|uniref:hypothetical protein n=1 Tax=Nostoc sp. CHAB 5836 TaxID=2780404 RepID=UPI001E3B923A|nr:hypothetical protein [Nostoc sp. CHAB 5836]MCC5618420.1 hypothetical protein [Nostoc sp. CHAB 5836]
MTHQLYTEEQLFTKSLPELKTIYTQIGAAVEVADKRCKSAWVNAIVAHQSSQVQKVDEQTVAQAELEQHIEEQQTSISSLPAWDNTIPNWNPPAAICPDCGGHGCGNCNYRGARAVDLCTPQDDYRLVYMGKTDSQTAYKSYKGTVALGILFRVRNIDEVWENDPKTYYWQCGNEMKYWSVREAIEALEKLTSPSVSVVNAREKRAATIEVLEQHNDEFVVHNCENDHYYVVRPNQADVKERCGCADCHYRSAKCKHQIAVENFIKPSLVAQVKEKSCPVCAGTGMLGDEDWLERCYYCDSVSVSDEGASGKGVEEPKKVVAASLDELLDKPFDELSRGEWEQLKETSVPTQSIELVAE